MRLLERIDKGSPSYKEGASKDSLLKHSIVDHLTRVLNTRKGSVPIDENYGLSDFNDVARKFPDTASELKNEIKTCIENYEPRLVDVDIRYAHKDRGSLELCFEIVARIADASNTQYVWLETRMDAQGKVYIDG